MKPERLLPVFFLSGFAALVFETIWFYQLRLSLGNSVWASGMTLTAFMSGLALGNFAMTVRARKVRAISPIKTYAILEVCIGLVGVSLVFVLPAVQDAVLGALSSTGGLAANLIRLAVAFVLLAIPATCMGATLPLLVGAMTRRHEEFGRILGFFYAANTAGAVVGAIAAEWWLIGSLKIVGAAIVAAGANIVAAGLSVSLARNVADEPQSTQPFRFHPGMLVGAVCGFSLLALEVIWFRYLSLYLSNTSQIFAVMLGVVLIGIAIGGAIGGRLSTSARSIIAPCLLLSGFATLFLFEFHLAKDYRSIWLVVFCAATLMLPVSLLSGVLFSTVGTMIHDDLQNATLSSGWLTVFNTVGSALGAFVATFVFLPILGSHIAVGVIGVLYGVTGFWIWRRFGAGDETDHQKKFVRFSLAAFVLSVVLFPFHSPIQQFVEDQEIAFDATVIGSTEGLTETGVLIEHPFMGKRHSVSLITNGYAMSGNQWGARRYMKQYVYLPVALMGSMDRALLICFGVGSTAKALVESPEIKHVDVVDISRDVFALSDKIFEEDEHPLRDPRTTFHVEDGRHFLATTDKTFDLITAEPPPPAVAGVVTLYTREFFALAKNRLNPGGMVTYWLPLFGLRQGSGASVVKAFCDVFEDCTLWSGMGDNLMMVGTNQRDSPVSESVFVQQWDPKRSAELTALGYEDPFQLGATFIADASTLKAQLEGVPLLEDMDPHRILDAGIGEGRSKSIYKAWMGVDGETARTRFFESEIIDRWFDERLQEKVAGWFKVQHKIGMISAAGTMPTYDLPHGKTVENFLWAQQHPTLSQPSLWTFDSDADYANIVKAHQGELPTDAAKFHDAAARTRAAFLTNNFDDLVARFESVDCASDFGKRSLQAVAIVHSLTGKAKEARDAASSAELCGGRRLVVDLETWLSPE